MAGYEGPAVGIELDRDACRTGMAAGHWRIQADVSTFPLAHLKGRVTGLIKSPPCPSFSTAGDGAGKADMPNVYRLIADFAAGRPPAQYEWVDERSRLTAEPMRWAAALRPRWIALEQVPPVLPLWKYMAELLRNQGYRTWTGVLSAEEYGVPQTRKRAIMVASLDGPVGPPAPTHQSYRSGREAATEPDLFGDLLPVPVSMADALGWATATVVRSNYGTGGDAQDRGERSADRPAATITSKVDRNVVLRNGLQANATERTSSAPALTIYSSRTTNLRWNFHAQGVDSGWGVPRGDDAPASTIKGAGRGGQYWVRDRPATTVCGDARLAAPGHRDREGGERQFGDGPVRVSVQEAGVLQSFPAGYPWCGTKTAQYRQVGDAMPPLLAAAILRPLLAAGSVRKEAA